MKNEDRTLPMISVITVCKDSASTICDTIESVLAQTYGNIEYILVDGKSKDNTVDIIKSYEKQFSEKHIQYRYVSEPDNGIYDAMNKGISMAEGELIGIINSDDWYEPQALKVAAESFARTQYDLFYADLRIINGRKSFIKKSKNSRLITSRYWNHPTTFIPKKIYMKFPYKTENIHDDWDLILRLRKELPQCKVCVVNQVLANFRRDGISHEKSIKKALKRAKIKYGIYRDNGYSRLYAVECYGMEMAKLML